MKDTARSSGFFTIETQLGCKEMILNIFVCVTCFELTSLGSGMQVCSCEEYKRYPGVDCPSGNHLCSMCAATMVGGTSRWSWNACASCLKFNGYLARTYKFALPLGRHSIMNSIGVPLKASQEVQKKATDEMLSFLDVARSIEDWGTLQARQLFESIYSWKKLSFIPIADWEAKFHLSKVKATTRSAQAFKDYLRVDDFGEV